MYHSSILLPNEYSKEFKILYHLTSIDSAIKILNSKTFISCDPDQQASFSILGQRSDIARNKEVCLRFLWPKAQALYFGDPFGKGEPNTQGINGDILHHIFHGDEEEKGSELQEGENLKNRKYWQSNLYPGASGLIYDGIEEINLNPPAIPSRWSCFFSSEYRSIKKSALSIRKAIENLKSLSDLSVNQQVFSIKKI